MTDNKKKDVTKPDEISEKTKKPEELSDTDLERIGGGRAESCSGCCPGTSIIENR